MSLVAYDASSDESDYEDNEEPVKATPTVVDSGPKSLVTNGQISDEDDDYLAHSEADFKSTSFALSLPKPRKESSIQEIIGNFAKSPFDALPTPKVVHIKGDIEEDDEYLHKKDNFVSTETKPPPSVVVPKGPVKISVPSLKEFHDVQREMASKVKAVPKGTTKSSGLLSILPKAKSERSFVKTEGATNEKGEGVNKVNAPIPALIPDTVKYRRSAYNTEGINDDTVVKRTVTQPKKKTVTITGSGDEMSDGEENAAKSGLDFFSLAADHDCLPDVSASEISLMVAKKAAKMAEATTKYLNEAESKATVERESERTNQQELELARKRYQESHLGAEATQALVGSSAKRRRNQNEQIHIMDLNSDQILPNRDEWMRTALASSTTYQPTGVLVDEEPVQGTRRKHQITYLAHKAKTNEAELQAIWAANRQTRRATQSKYGF